MTGIPSGFWSDLGQGATAALKRSQEALDHQAREQLKDFVPSEIPVPTVKPPEVLGIDKLTSHHPHNPVADWHNDTTYQAFIDAHSNFPTPHHGDSFTSHPPAMPSHPLEWQDPHKLGTFTDFTEPTNVYTRPEDLAIAGTSYQPHTPHLDPNPVPTFEHPAFEDPFLNHQYPDPFQM